MNDPVIYYCCQKSLHRVNEKYLPGKKQTAIKDFGSVEYYLIRHPDYLKLDCSFILKGAGSFRIEFPKNHLLAIISLDSSVKISSGELELLLAKGCYQVLYSLSGILHLSLSKFKIHSLIFITIPTMVLKPLKIVYLLVNKLFDSVDHQKDASLFIFPRIIPVLLNLELRLFNDSGINSRLDKDYFGQNLLSSLRYELYDACRELLANSFTLDESHNEEQFYKAVWLILQNPSSRFSMKILAYRINISEYHLKKIFKKKFNFSVHEFQEHVRIEKAKKLLEKDHSVEDIALQLGYSSISHFSFVFKRKTGLRPTIFRKYQNNGPDKISAKLPE
jgi:AraC-like DNA-binding protein